MSNEKYRTTILDTSTVGPLSSCLGKPVKMNEWTEYSEKELRDKYRKSRPDLDPVAMLLGDPQLYVERWNGERREWQPASFRMRPQQELINMAFAEAARLSKEREERMLASQREQASVALATAQAAAEEAVAKAREAELKAQQMAAATEPVKR